MATGEEVLAFRAAGHSVSATAAHFGISESRVYQLAREARGSEPVVKSSSFPQPADDLAGEDTYWRCPVCQELKPVVPGSRRHAWMEEQKRLHARPPRREGVAGDPRLERPGRAGVSGGAGAAGMQGGCKALESGITPVPVAGRAAIESVGVCHNVVWVVRLASGGSVNTFALLQGVGDRYRMVLGLVVLSVLVGLCVSGRAHAVALW